VRSKADISQEPRTKVKNRKNYKVKKNMLNSKLIGKQSGESVEGVESVLKKKKKATVGRICRKGRSDK